MSRQGEEEMTMVYSGRGQGKIVVDDTFIKRGRKTQYADDEYANYA
jgi:hypothetical protein